MISAWCIVAIVALIAGTIVAIKNKDGDSFRASVVLAILIGFGKLITLGFWYLSYMILHEKYCKKCHKITNHRELKKDYFECAKCGLKTIENNKINEKDINIEDVSYYIYAQEEFLFFNDILSSNVFLREDIKKLLQGEILRVPVYRHK